MQYLPLFLGSRGYFNAPHCNVKRTLSVLRYIEMSLCRFLKSSYRDNEQKYLANVIDVFRVLLCTFLLYWSRIRSSKYGTDYFYVCTVHFDYIINSTYSKANLLRPTTFGLRIFCAASIIFYVSGFPDRAKLTLVHSHTHFRVYMYHLLLYWRLKGIELENWACG